LRLLPRNDSAYNDHERTVLEASGREGKRDIERDRRLHDGEEPAILAALRGQRRPDRERPLELPDGDALLDLYLLIVNTGLRLREAYRLRVPDVRLKQYTLHVAASKTGAKRDVPIVPAISPLLKRRVLAAKSKSAPIFPWWSGENNAEELAAITAFLSRAFARAFDYAGCEDLREHDLRHEATCRWVTMRDKDGGRLFRAEEVMRITGHKDARTFMRYVSFRGSDLAARLWK
jgi:integrase